MKTTNDLLQEMQKTMETFGEVNPTAMQGFKKFMGGSKEDGALSKKMKEIIGVALSVSRQCEWCVALHVKNALQEGATKEEILEACLVAAMMGGGPSLMFTANVLKSIKELSE
ncbi:MAG: carboxymuconolactone decarboxylase family protein [Candidatus Lokiarchaeota archaeon]|nr:carboxymuconolactone decarboxylase family protein [Candidatus Lokiarchaeota archaeon]MBD3200328.1 carboxymuconolactone decarboxylase family protein [Candidatus Lokiarchaeota archaeon]